MRILDALDKLGEDIIEAVGNIGREVGMLPEKKAPRKKKQKAQPPPEEAEE